MKKSKAKKEITLDDLAVMVQNGFTELRSEVKSDFKLVNKRIDRLDEKIEILDKKIEDIQTDVSDIKVDLNKKADRFELNGLEYRVEKLEKKYV